MRGKDVPGRSLRLRATGPQRKPHQPQTPWACCPPFAGAVRPGTASSFPISRREKCSTARALGVAETTIARDLGKPRGATNVAAKELEPAPEPVPETEDAPNVAPAWFQNDVDPAELAKKSAGRSARDADIKARREEAETEAAEKIKQLGPYLRTYAKPLLVCARALAPRLLLACLQALNATANSVSARSQRENQGKTKGHQALMSTNNTTVGRGPKPSHREKVAVNSGRSSPANRILATSQQSRQCPACDLQGQARTSPGRRKATETFPSKEGFRAGYVALSDVQGVTCGSRDRGVGWTTADMSSLLCTDGYPHARPPGRRSYRRARGSLR